ncbi:ppk15 [Symbiodinium pilosum]|uniref:Ppk15 protein n=1 Tax=Symbiodinium pilosum TaxID=2952 RepID=A0A812S225_SYMPI|nr:ppk15 [Symbiodinium pilosum]
MAFLDAPKNFQPPNARERREEPLHGSLLRSLTVDLITTYQQCCADFVYSDTTAPRRVLTKLSKGVYNGNFDNAEHDYICRVGDKIVNPDGHAYEILERLGHGTFGQVLKIHHSTSNSHVALKIIKNKPAYFHQALVEVRILQMLNQEFDPDDDKRIVRMLDFFVYRKHLCIAFELLSVNLYEVLKQNSFRGVSMALIRVLTDQLLKALRCLREASVIHCDLKPENVLLSNIHHTRIKLIDFGSACFESHTVYPYIQSRFYRSPEVLLGVPYTSAIDMWSLGCICAELFLGLPVFPGHSEYNQVCRIVEVLRMPPSSLLDAGRNTRRYFRKVQKSCDRISSFRGRDSCCESPGSPRKKGGERRRRRRHTAGNGVTAATVLMIHSYTQNKKPYEQQEWTETSCKRYEACSVSGGSSSSGDRSQDRVLCEP